MIIRSQSKYLADRASAARLLRNSATASSTAAVHDSFARLYDKRSAQAGAQEAALIAQAHAGEQRMALGLGKAVSGIAPDDHRWIGAGGSVLASRLAPASSYDERSGLG
jgi:hypothetical protein